MTEVKIHPFAALRPPASLAPEVASVPYDVVSAGEARKLAMGKPFSFLHVSRPEIDMEAGADPSSASAYAQARKALDALRSSGALLKDGEAHLYAYRQIMGCHEQTGVVGCFDTAAYRDGTLKRHEKTRADKEDDRTRHVLALEAHTGPVFLTYPDAKPIDSIVGKAKDSAPIFDFTADDGIRHTGWIIDDAAKLAEEFSKIPCAYIADGHHRAAAAARAADERGGEYRHFLAVIFPASQLCILPYNRVVKALNSLSAEEFLAKVKSIFTISEAEGGKVTHCHSAKMYLAGKWYGLSWEIDPSVDPVGALDVSVLQNRLLGPVLGIDDPRTSENISFVGGIRGIEELEKRVDDGSNAVAFSMYPVTVGEMMAIADAGQIMPPKSTWFEPKLRSGLFVHAV